MILVIMKILIGVLCVLAIPWSILWWKVLEDDGIATEASLRRIRNIGR